MNEFNNVTVIKAANIYFDGKVTSHTVLFDVGERKTLGVMLPGEYTFGTEKAELMEIQTGEVEVMLPGSNNWQRITAGETFQIPASASFDIKVNVITDYCCSYLD